MSGISAIVTKVDLSPLDGIVRNLDKAQATLVEQVLEGCTPYVPVRTGALQGSATAGQDSVTWNEDYAAHVYHGTSRMPGRPWFEQAAAAESDSWISAIVDTMGVG